MLADVLATTIVKGAIQCYTVLDSQNESEFNPQILYCLTVRFMEKCYAG